MKEFDNRLVASLQQHTYREFGDLEQNCEMLDCHDLNLLEKLLVLSGKEPDVFGDCWCRLQRVVLARDSSALLGKAFLLGVTLCTSGGGGGGVEFKCGQGANALERIMGWW